MKYKLKRHRLDLSEVIEGDPPPIGTKIKVPEDVKQKEYKRIEDTAREDFFILFEDGEKLPHTHPRSLEQLKYNTFWGCDDWEVTGYVFNIQKTIMIAEVGVPKKEQTEGQKMAEGFRASYGV